MNFKWSYVVMAFLAAMEKYNVTMSLSIVSFILALVLGTLIAVIRAFRVPLLHRIFQVLTVIGKGIPIVLMIYIVNYSILKPLDYFANKYNNPQLSLVDKYWLLLIAFIIFGTINVTEVIRGAIAGVSAGQFEAAYSIGMKKWQAMFRVVLPQAIKTSVPTLCNNFIGQLKYTSMASLLSVTDVTNAAIISVKTSYRFLEAYMALAIIYWITCIFFEQIFNYIERKMGITTGKKKRRSFAL